MNKYRVRITILDEKISNDIIQEKIQKLLLQNVDFQIFECEILQYYPSSDQMTMRISLKNDEMDAVIIGFHYLNEAAAAPNIKFVKKLVAERNLHIFLQDSPDWLSFNERMEDIFYKIRSNIEESILTQNEGVDELEAMDEEEGKLPPMQKGNPMANDHEIAHPNKKDMPDIPDIKDVIAENRLLAEDVYGEYHEESEHISSIEIKSEKQEEFTKENHKESKLIPDDEALEEKFEDFTKNLDLILEAAELSSIVDTSSENEEESILGNISSSRKEFLFDIFKKEKKEKTYQSETPLIREEKKIELKEQKKEIKMSNEELMLKLDSSAEQKERSTDEGLKLPLLYNQERVHELEAMGEEEGNFPQVEEELEDEPKEAIEKPKKNKREKEPRQKKVTIPKLPKLTLPEKKALSLKGSVHKSKEIKTVSTDGISDNIDIGFIGNLNGVGTSFIALELAKYLATNKQEVCFIDMKNEIHAVLIELELPFEIYNTENYRESYKKKTIRIFDFGVLNLNNKRELIDFERCQKKFVVGNMSDIKGYGYNKNFEYAEEVDFISIVNFSSTIKKSVKTELKGLNIILFPFVESDQDIPVELIDSIK